MATPARDTAPWGRFTLQLRGPFSVGVAGEAHTCSSLSEPPFQRVLVLIIVFAMFGCWAGLYRGMGRLSRNLSTNNAIFLTFYVLFTILNRPLSHYVNLFCQGCLLYHPVTPRGRTADNAPPFPTNIPYQHHHQTYSPCATFA